MMLPLVIAHILICTCSGSWFFTFFKIYTFITYFTAKSLSLKLQHISKHQVKNLVNNNSHFKDQFIVSTCARHK